MPFDSRSFTEKQFPIIRTEKEIGGASFQITVNGNRTITNLTYEQADQVNEALRHGMGEVVRNMQRRMREFLGKPT